MIMWRLSKVLALIGVVAVSGAASQYRDPYGQDAHVTHEVTFTIRVGEQLKSNLTLELFGNDVKKTVTNFITLAQLSGKEGYQGSTFHRIIPGFMFQGGDFTNQDGTGGKSIYGARFEDEAFVFDHKVGALSMANAGENTNGSQFFVTTSVTPWLNGKHVVFGRVKVDDDSSQSVMKQIEAVGSPSGKPSKNVRIVKSFVTQIDKNWVP